MVYNQCFRREAANYTCVFGAAQHSYNIIILRGYSSCFVASGVIIKALELLVALWSARALFSLFVGKTPY